MMLLQDGCLEEHGIPAEAVQEMEAQLKAFRIPMHGYLLLQGRSIVGEKYYAPYDADSLHRMYSVTKSFTALAMGLLVRQGRVSLSDPICSYFPEYVSEGETHPWCREMTIEDMLTMRTCHSSTTYKRYESPDWTESFFKVKPDHVPGTLFSYDTSSSHVLTALTEKLTGMSTIDYMRHNLLNVLGFSKNAYILADPVGISQGGSGLMCTLRDMAKVAYLCCHYGNLDGEQLLPKDFMQKALTKQVTTALQPKLDEQYGYGYFFWMPREEGFCMYGMGGQLALCFPKLDFCLLTMADANGIPAGLQIMYDCFYRTVFPWLKEHREENPLAFEASRAMEEREKSWRQAEAQTRKETEGLKYRFYKNSMGLAWIAFHWQQEYMELANDQGTFTFSFGEGEGPGQGDGSSGQDHSGLGQGTGGWTMQRFMDTGYRCGCRGKWKCGHFIMECYLMDEEMGHVNLEVAWKDERLSVHAESTSEPFFARLKGFASAVQEACLGGAT